jgi:hypothetical protein
MNDFPATPLWAEGDDLAKCLSQLGTRPLKLVAEAAQPAFAESGWSGGPWSFTAAAESGVADKDLLPNPADLFQFSVCGPHSKQDFHRHEGVFEIYASESGIEILYLDPDGQQQTATVRSGVVMVPPGIPHKVSLTGFTFVFQVATSGGQVHNDKAILP